MMPTQELMTIGAMVPNPELQQAMYDAYDDLVAKKETYDRMMSALADLRADLVAKQEQADAARSQYMNGFSQAGGSGAVSQDAKTAQELSIDLGAKVEAMKVMITDFAEPIKAAGAEVKAAHWAFVCAYNIVAAKMAIKAPPPNAALHISALTHDGFDLRGAVLAYLVHFEGAVLEMGSAFDTLPAPPHRFFDFLRQFFRNPTWADLPAMRAEVKALIWGERPVPPEIELP